MSEAWTIDRTALDDLMPMVRRLVDLDPNALARLRFGAGSATLLASLPFGVLASRTVVAEPVDPPVDVTVSAAQAVSWYDDLHPEPPANRDADWRGGSPPFAGWTRLDTVPGEVVRGLVQQGARALQQAAEREGVPGAQPRAEVADTLLDSVVLTVEGAGHTTELTLRTISALTRMGFLPTGGVVGVDVAGRWTRVAAGYGSVFAERPGASLNLR